MNSHMAVAKLKGGANMNKVLAFQSVEAKGERAYDVSGSV